MNHKYVFVTMTTKTLQNISQKQCILYSAKKHIYAKTLIQTIVAITCTGISIGRYITNERTQRGNNRVFYNYLCLEGRFAFGRIC